MKTEPNAAKTEKVQINLNFGFLGDDILVQLKEYGFKLSKKDADEIESVRRSVLSLHMKDFLTDSAVRGLVRKMTKFVQENMVEIDG